MKQMGIAGDDSWGAMTHEEFLLDNKNPMTFSFEFKGI
jgi:beta-galactosidase